MRRRWPDDERGLAERVDSAISRLGDLDGTDDNPSPAAFGRALQLELETAPSRHGRLGAGVLVGPVDLALGIELDLAVVCGMAEGPSRRVAMTTPCCPTASGASPAVTFPHEATGPAKTIGRCSP